MRDKVFEADTEFMKGLSDAQWKQAEAIEAEIGQILKDGFTEKVGLMFVRAVMAIRDIEPAATVGGIYDTALEMGLRELCVKMLADRKAKAKRKTGSKLR